MTSSACNEAGCRLEKGEIDVAIMILPVDRPSGQAFAIALTDYLSGR